MKKQRALVKRNPMARELANPLYRQRTVKVKKGFASYRRKSKHQKDAIDD